LKSTSGEARERREAQGGLHAVEVHIGDTGDRVVAPGDHVLVADRVHAPLLGRLAGDGVQSDGGEDLTVVGPEVLAIHLDDARPGLTELLGQPVLPHPRVFDQVVVDRHDLVVVLQRHEASRSVVSSSFLALDLKQYNI
jgi:hypothetical protein